MKRYFTRVVFGRYMILILVYSTSLGIRNASAVSYPTLRQLGLFSESWRACYLPRVVGQSGSLLSWFKQIQI